MVFPLDYDLTSASWRRHEVETFRLIPIPEAVNTWYSWSVWPHKVERVYTFFYSN